MPDTQGQDVPLSDLDRRQLLELARRSVREAAAGGKPSDFPSGGVMDRPGGAFVTLKRASDDSLRGCIGHFTGFGRLGETVSRMARAAAVEDPRFPPVAPVEVGSLRIEISLLSPMRSADPADVVPGRHGLYVRSGPFAGTLLPQVAV
ncbi:AmmeMemoRadiSam system protein A, partial [Candidatus Fermentibacterales bacterium]|nr:AmmeMemoRadiSam system protein A [Candidatus Fermentibacterales bacterium]